MQNSRSFACSENLEKEPEDSPNIVVLNKFRECDERLSDIKIKIDERSEKFGVRLKVIHEIQQMFLDLNRLILTYYEDNSSKFNTHKDLSLFGWNKLKKLTVSNNNEDLDFLDIGPLSIPHEVNNSDPCINEDSDDSNDLSNEEEKVNTEDSFENLEEQNPQNLIYDPSSGIPQEICWKINSEITVKSDK